MSKPIRAILLGICFFSSVVGLIVVYTIYFKAKANGDSEAYGTIEPIIPILLLIFMTSGACFGHTLSELTTWRFTIGKKGKKK